MKKQNALNQPNYSKNYFSYLITSLFLLLSFSPVSWGGWEEEREARIAFELSQGMCYRSTQSSSSSDAPSHAQCAAAAENYKWPGPYPRTLKVKVSKDKAERVSESSFEDRIEHVQRIASTWSRYAGIKFDMGKDFGGDHDIVLFFDNQSVCWSTIGTHPTKLKKAEGKPAIHLRWDTPDEDILHEFGHILSLVHETQNPEECGFKFKSNQQVCDYYHTKYGWDEDMVMQNILRPRIQATNHSSLDFASIMMYPFPKEIIEGNYEIPKNKELSPLDKKFISQLYPKDDFIYVPVDDARVSKTLSALGDLFESAGVIWSGVVQQKMNYPDACQHCQSAGARLPTQQEWETLARAMRADGSYDPDLLPGTKEEEFWSSTVDAAQNVYYFKGKEGGLEKSPIRAPFVRKFRCVVSAGARSSRSPVPVPKPASPLVQRPGVISTPKPAPKATSAVGVFVKIPGGKFLMGSPSTEKDRGNDERQHEVSLSPFEMAKAVVTQVEYASITGTNPSKFKEQKHCPNTFKQIEVKGVQISMCPDHPVEQVSWDDAQEFIRLVNHAFYGEGYTYSLPTEAQTEYAIRGGTITAWVSGADESQLGKYVIYNANSQNQTQPVKSKLANRFGIYRGGVWEWTQDWYSENYEGSQGLDPKGPSTGSRRVIRGGSWCSSAQGCRSAYRGCYGPEIRNYGIGFRLCRRNT